LSEHFRDRNTKYTTCALGANRWIRSIVLVLSEELKHLNKNKNSKGILVVVVSRRHKGNGEFKKKERKKKKNQTMTKTMHFVYVSVALANLEFNHTIFVSTGQNLLE
jgi:hypothetical protein